MKQVPIEMQPGVKHKFSLHSALPVGPINTFLDLGLPVNPFSALKVGNISSAKIKYNRKCMW